jgi:hypothetical protein
MGRSQRQEQGAPDRDEQGTVFGAEHRWRVSVVKRGRDAVGLVHHFFLLLYEFSQNRRGANNNEAFIYISHASVNSCRAMKP